MLLVYHLSLRRDQGGVFWFMLHDDMLNQSINILLLVALQQYVFPLF